MSTQIAVRLPDEVVHFVDAQVASGAVRSRADFISRAIKREQRRLAAERDVQILAAAPYAEFEDMHEHGAQRGYSSPD
jgi:antitoxin MazE3